MASSTRTGDRQRFARHRTGQLERLVGPAQSAFAVDHHGQLVVSAGDAPVGAQFPQRQREVADRVRGDRQGLPHHGDAAGATGRGHGVPMRQLRVLLDEAGGHGQVPGDLLGVLLAQRLQLGAGDAVEVFRLHVLGDERVVVAGAHRLDPVRVAILRQAPAGVRRGRRAPACRRWSTAVSRPDVAGSGRRVWAGRYPDGRQRACRPVAGDDLIGFGHGCSLGCRIIDGSRRDSTTRACASLG